MLTLPQISQGLKDRRLHMIAKQIGLSYPTLKKLRDMDNDNYSLKTLELISEYLINTNINGGPVQQLELDLE